MNKLLTRKKAVIGTVIAISLLLAMVAVSYGLKNSSSTKATLKAEPSSSEEASSLQDSEGTLITFKGSTASIVGAGAQFKGDTLTISTGGTYTITGSLSDGRIIVDAKGKDVALILNNTSISSSSTSPLYIYKASSVTITLPDGTSSTLSDGSQYSYKDSYSSETDEEPNAALYSKADLTITGSGSLIVNGNFKNGITSKDNLKISETQITVDAVNHGINGKDSNVIENALISVVSGGDAIRSTNDTDASLGYIKLSNTTLTLEAGEDGIQAITTLDIVGGTYTIISGNGSEATVSSEESAKGIKAGGDITIESGSFTINSSDDSIHSNGNVAIKGGELSLTSGDDGIHADKTLAISDGKITVTKSYEGLEGLAIEISGGTIDITSEDDGINAAGGNDNSGFKGFMGNISSSSSDYYIDISGGSITVDADGDGIDANGNIYMTDGTLTVYGPTNNGNGALDYDGDFKLEGGTLLALGSSGMAQTPDNVTQYTLSATLSNTLSSDSYIELKSSSNTFIIKTKKSIQNIVFSSPDIKKGETYSISYGGSLSKETSEYGLLSSGTYSGGTEAFTITIEDYITTYGRTGIDGSDKNNFIGKPGKPGSNPGNGNMTPPSSRP